MARNSVWKSHLQPATDPCPVGLRGIVPSLNTPFDANGAVDLMALRRLVDHCVFTGCAGILCLAVASEADALSESEKREIAECVVLHAGGRIPVVVAVSDVVQEVRLARADHAAQIGANGILCQLPAQSRADRLAMVDEIGAAGPDFFMIQDLDWSGPGLPVPEIVDLFERVPRFASLKIEVAPAGPKYSAVLEATKGQLHVCGGWAVLQMIEGLRRGIHGFMPTCMEPLYVEIYRRFQSNDEPGARQLHADLLPVLAFSNQHISTSIRFFKRLRQIEGLFETDACRPPLLPLDEPQKYETQMLISHLDKLYTRYKIQMAQRESEEGEAADLQE
ncbi:MAG: dihydrodipicolinate synthase family protein [Alphaproteobacteria bacterium]|nr:dihydrodipicolinate synthase family protein [Alphaproteobacteria bacterium]